MFSRESVHELGELNAATSGSSFNFTLLWTSTTLVLSHVRLLSPDQALFEYSLATAPPSNLCMKGDAE